jgi:hypothetical protein
LSVSAGGWLVSSRRQARGVLDSALPSPSWAACLRRRARRLWGPGHGLHSKPSRRQIPPLRQLPLQRGVLRAPHHHPHRENARVVGRGRIMINLRDLLVLGVAAPLLLVPVQALATSHCPPVSAVGVNNSGTISGVGGGSMGVGTTTQPEPGTTGAGGAPPSPEPGSPGGGATPGGYDPTKDPGMGGGPPDLGGGTDFGGGIPPEGPTSGAAGGGSPVDQPGLKPPPPGPPGTVPPSPGYPCGSPGYPPCPPGYYPPVGPYGGEPPAQVPWQGQVPPSSGPGTPPMGGGGGCAPPCHVRPDGGGCHCPDAPANPCGGG